MIQNRWDLVKKYLEFFKSKEHHEIPSASLIPENDPTVLFTTAGMHPLVPFLTGQRHPHGKRLVDVQKCIRTGDIEDVGDEVHHTFFEMLGNWGLGDYWKKEAIGYSFEFLTSKEWLGIDKSKLAVSCFAGDDAMGVKKDIESSEYWLKMGIPEEKIVFLSKSQNWWGPAGESGPCGPDSEMFYWAGKGEAPKEFNPEDKRWVEIWNDVFMQYNKTKDGKYELLEHKNVDTGMGVERTVAVLLGLDDNYLTPGFVPIIAEIEKLSGKKYDDHKKAFRIIADHLRASVFILGDERGVKPGNLGQGYVLRRLIRRAIRYGKILGINGDFTVQIAKTVLPIYPDYQELHRNHKIIFDELQQEEERFGKTLEKGLKIFEKIARDDIITGREAFLLFQSYGFPIEMTVELANEKGASVDLEEYNAEFKRHQDLSRTASAGQFKSGLADDSEQTKKLHTATHLLLEALKRVLNFDVKQKGSNITPARSRFDFSFDRKLTEEEKKEAEDLVNEKIQAGLEVKREELPLKEAFDSGAMGEFGAKYPDIVSVYTIIDSTEPRGYFSKEICTGPHVKNTRELGKFKILKEESASAGVRRIRSVVE
ncbi:MAG: alanine--tRNA ligase [Nanoarchaeota archaeon]|nr:alanine--tRNA ligase [Nanoarchaeota archaeon]MBU0977341.1 alanine--tRNA ligase [Nanoarchaeota archaeon]